MKAKVKETDEIINVQCLYPVTYSRLDCNGKIIEEYDEDELEFLKEKVVDKDNKRLEDWDKINSDDRCLINSYSMNVINYLMNHGLDINDDIIDKIQDTLVDFYKSIKK